MTHDPLCVTDADTLAHECPTCHLIAKARSDQRERDADTVDDYARETHHHVGGSVAFCDQRLGDRCDVTSALKTAAERLREKP